MRARTIVDVAATVRARRQELQLSQAALAERAGVSRKWVSEFERGKSRAELLMFLRILEALGLEMDLSVPGAAPDVVGDWPGHPAIDLDELLERHRG